MKNILILLILVLFQRECFSQSGPAGVGNTSSNKLWLKGDGGAFTDLGVTQATNGQQVRQWNDRSGNNNHATQNTAANRPLFKANSANGQPGLRFTGDLFIDGPSPGIDATSSYTYFMAFRDTSMVNGGIGDGDGAADVRNTATRTSRIARNDRIIDGEGADVPDAAGTGGCRIAKEGGIVNGKCSRIDNTAAADGEISFRPGNCDA